MYDGDIVVIVDPKEEKIWGWLVKKYHVKTNPLATNLFSVRPQYGVFCFGFSDWNEEIALAER